MMEPICPVCGGRVVYEFACHTFPQTKDDGTEVWMACLSWCDSAIEYLCWDSMDFGYSHWRYIHGLNPRNPRAEENETNRPDWLPDKPRKIDLPGGAIIVAHEGVCHFDDACAEYRRIAE